MGDRGTTGIERMAKARRGWPGVWTTLAAALLCCLAQNAEAAPRRVLVLNSFGNNYAPFSEISATYRTQLSEQSPEPIEFYEALLETTRINDPASERPYADYLRALMAERRFDLVAVVGGPALQLWMRNRDRISPEGPVIIGGMEERLIRDVPLGPNEAFAGCKSDLGGLVEGILRLLPGTRRISVIVGDSPIERFWLKQVQAAYKPFEGRVEFEWLSDLPAAEMRQRAAALPPHSAIIYGMLMLDRAGIPNEQDRMLDLLHKEANAPVFGYFENQLGRGIVGGMLVSIRIMGGNMARASVRILAGETPGSIIMPPAESEAAEFDWRELKRWGIPESRLPAGSVVRFRPPSMWELYRRRVLAGIFVVLTQAAAIAGLLIQRRRSRRMKAEIAEGDERMRLAADAAKLGVWGWHIEENEIWMSGKGRQIFGLPETGRLDPEAVAAALHPEDRSAFRRALELSVAGGGERDEEYRAVRPDGGIHWIGLRHKAEFDREGKAILLRGVCLDVTHRRASELELEKLRGQISHVGRVSVMGQLASALAHELNQPLGAIRSNADAATLFLQSEQPDVEEVRAILDDIRKDDQRASDVIVRMRRLLKRREIEIGEVNLHELIEQAVALLRPDAMARRVALEVRLEEELPVVRGDGVHLQQVLINLMMNGMDALGEDAGESRRLIIAAGRVDNGMVEISVSDNGHGLAPEAMNRLFDEFYTTKAEGMGMGLPISKTIIEAHGGRIRGGNNPEGGAIFRFTLQAI